MFYHRYNRLCERGIEKMELLSLSVCHYSLTKSKKAGAICVAGGTLFSILVFYTLFPPFPVIFVACLFTKDDIAIKRHLSLMLRHYFVSFLWPWQLQGSR